MKVAQAKQRLGPRIQSEEKSVTAVSNIPFTSFLLRFLLRCFSHYFNLWISYHLVNSYFSNQCVELPPPPSPANYCKPYSQALKLLHGLYIQNK